MKEFDVSTPRCRRNVRLSQKNRKIKIKKKYLKNQATPSYLSFWLNQLLINDSFKKNNLKIDIKVVPEEIWTVN